MLISCNRQGESKQVSSANVAQKTISKKQNLKKQNACKVFSKKQISKWLEVNESALQQEDMSFGEKRSICYYYTKEGNRKLFIRLAWKSDKAKENKVLQRQYTNYLSKGEKNITAYKELANSDGNQILFGIGQDHEGKYISIIRKRFGNNAEAQIEITKEQQDEGMNDFLLTVINHLE